MKTLPSWLLLLSLAMASPVLAQARPAPPGSPADRQIAPQGTNPEGNGTSVRPTPTCEEMRRRARYNIYFDKVDIEKLVQTVSDATCRTFILPENVRGKISILGPENGRVEVDADQFYAAFLAALDANGLSVYQHGRFLKIVDKRAAKQNPIPTLMDDEASFTTNEQMITKLFRIKNVEVEPLRGVLQQLVSKDGDTIPYPPDIIIINDVGSNVHRLERIIDQLDSRSASDEVRIIQVQYATAQDIAATVQKLFEQTGGPNPAGGMGGGRPGQRGAPAMMNPPGGSVGETMPMSPPGGESAANGPVTFSQMIPDERTNKLIVVASPAAFERIQSLVRELDIPTAGTERINVYPLENANSEEIASTLQTLSQGTGNRPRSPVPVPGAPGMPRQQQGSSGGAAELFSGEVKISADKGTNSLVIIASQSDYRSLVRVIRELDKPRRQVFVEAVIMEVNLDRSREFGLNLHQGFSLPVQGSATTGVVGTKYSKTGVPPSFSLGNLVGFGGFLAGLQGPIIPALKELGIPAFGIVLHALQQSSDVNVLSTPHLLTSDNEEAEITVGQNVPFQSGFSPTSLGSGLGTAAGAAGAGGIGSLLGGLASQYAPITRQNVELKLTIKPQINESDFIRMAITEQTEEIASTDQVLGPTTSKRSAKTTVVAKDQETVVIGGIMQERTLEDVSKVPILGDVPLLGHLFRSTNQRKTKTNLLLFLTPYIIREQSDFRRIFERKMRERQQFVEQFYGQVAGYDVPVDFTRKTGPLGRMRRVVLTEEQKAENGGPGMSGERILRPAGSPPASSPVPAGSPGEVPPRAGGSQTPAAPEAPAVQPPSAPPPEDPERLRIQPDTGDQE
jgi:general secretion pathway protein D